MRVTVPIMAALLALAACDSEPMPLTPSSPSVRLPVVPGRPAVGYFSLRFFGDRGALISITSAGAGRVEMHETMSSGNMTSMRPIRRIPVRDGETITFAPGGRHLMLFDLDPSVRVGGQINLTFNFERGAPVTVAGTIIAPDDDMAH